MARTNYALLNVETGQMLHITQRQKTQDGRNFCMVDLSSAEMVAKAETLHGTEYKVLWFLLSKLDYNNNAILTQSFVAQSLSMPQPQVSASIKKLCATGVIKKINVNGANGYYVDPRFAVKGTRKDKDAIDQV